MNDKIFYFDEKEQIFYTEKDGPSFKSLFESLKPINKEWEYRQINDIPVTISKNNKEIKFIKAGEQEKKIFVVNVCQVFFLLNKFKFSHYKVDGAYPHKIIDDKLNFSEIEYFQNLLFKADYVKTKEDISKKDKILLEDLSLMYYDYLKYQNLGEFTLSEERKDFFNNLTKLSMERQFIPICGPKYIGKTTSLLYYLKTNMMGKYFYMNLSYCKKLLLKGEKERLYLCICKELFNCMNFEDVNRFYSSLDDITYVNIMDIVLFILKYLNEEFKSNRLYIVLDQYKEKIDNDYSIIQEIKTLINKYSVITLFVCSSINEFDFRNSLIKKFSKKNQFYLNYLFVNKLISVNLETIRKDFTEEEIQLLNESGNLFSYFCQIDDNKRIKTLDPSSTRLQIKDHIKNKINEYFNEKDPNRKINKIKIISDNMDKEITFMDLEENLSCFPFKFFNMYKENKNILIVEDLENDTKLVISPSYPIVYDCLSEIFQDSKNDIKKNSLVEKKINTNKAESSSELENNFEDYLWIFRHKFSCYGCKLKYKIHVNTLLDMEKTNAEKIKKIADKLENISESILIIQDDQNAKHYDTAILKLSKIENGQKFFVLYLFQETLRKEAKERLYNLLLNEDKICLKYKFYMNCSIKIENIFFSYIFGKNSLDNTTINYCKDSNISYQIYDDNLPELIDYKTNPIIIPKFEYPVPSKKNKNIKKFEFPLDVLDIDYSKDLSLLNEEYNKLNNFLQKKRILKKNKPQIFLDKIKELENYVNNDFRKFAIEDALVHEYSMKNEKNIVGISFLIDNETKKIIDTLSFGDDELYNLYRFMEKYNNNLEILKIIKLSEEKKKSLDHPNYDCCLIQVNQNKEKFFIDTKSKKVYSLKNIDIYSKLDLSLDIFLIKFITKTMIYSA